MSNEPPENAKDSISVRGLRSAGSDEYADELAALESSEKAAETRHGTLSRSLVQRLIYGPQQIGRAHV